MLLYRPVGSDWQLSFAWLPVQLNEFQSVWLERYEWRVSPLAPGFQMRRHIRQRPDRQFDISTARGILTAHGMILDPPSQDDRNYRIQRDKFDTATEPMTEAQVIEYARQLEEGDRSRADKIFGKAARP